MAHFWSVAAAELTGSHLDEVKRMVAHFRQPVVRIVGAGLSVGQVAAVALAKDGLKVTVQLADEARPRVKACSEWILDSVANGGDIYGVTTVFGGTSHRRTKDGQGLQVELVRYKSPPTKFCISTSQRRVDWFLCLGGQGMHAIISFLTACAC